jgi:hypothetical protein
LDSWKKELSAANAEMKNEGQDYGEGKV